MQDIIPDSSLNISPNTYILSGIKPVLELLEREPHKVDCIFLQNRIHHKNFEKILMLCRQEKIKYIFTTSHKLDCLCPTNHQGIIARIFDTGFVDIETLFSLLPKAHLPLIIMLDQIQDPGNAGTLIRTLYALGGVGIIIPKHNCTFLGSGARRAAAGALEQLPVAKVTNLSQTLDKASLHGLHIYGTAINAHTLNQNIYNAKLTMPAILILGNEEHGIRLQLRNRCHTMLYIPMRQDINSINVAQAGGIFISHFAQKHLYTV